MTKSKFTDAYLFSLTNSSTVVYVEHTVQPTINAFIQEHFEEIVERFQKRSVNFVYLPALLESGAYVEVFDYNHPYRQLGLGELPLELIYGELFKTFGMTGQSSGLLVIDSLNGPELGTFLAVDAGTVSMRLFESMAERLDSVINDSILYCEIEDVDMQTYFISEASKDYSPDIEAEVEAMVSRLKELGSVQLIGKVIDELQKVTNKVSRLFITNDFRIFLKDYGMREVVMQPLAKCLFLLYLRHEEGIRFKQLSEFQDELLSIYKEVTQRERPDDVEESIRAMTDPLDNSVNEKCSRIRAAFVMVVAEELAEEYFITGKKGEVKRIRLDRGLVEFHKK